MLLSARQKLILLSIVHEYIKHARPVSSQLVARSFQLSPATLRNEFMKLEEEKYLFQPHTSSGRIPTDKGYRFFVNVIISKQKKNREHIARVFREVIKLKKETELLTELARKIAFFSGSAVFVASSHSKRFFKTGLNKVLGQPEFSDNHIRQHFGDMFDSFDDNFDELFDILNATQDPTVFIGRENPIGNIRDFSMIALRYKINTSEGIVVVIGPKRMNYEKSFSALNTWAELLS